MLVWRCWLCTIHKGLVPQKGSKGGMTQNHRRGQPRDVDTQLFVQTWPYHSFHVTSYRLRYLFRITPMILTKFRKANVFQKKVYTLNTAFTFYLRPFFSIDHSHRRHVPLTKLNWCNKYSTTVEQTWKRPSNGTKTEISRILLAGIFATLNCALFALPDLGTF